MTKIRPAVPQKKTNEIESIAYYLDNRGLSQEEYDKYLDSKPNKFNIYYKGNMHYLDFLLQQLANSSKNHVRLLVTNLEVDHSVQLPLSMLGPNIEIDMQDMVGWGQEFYHYALNMYDINFEFLKKHISEKFKIQLSGERKIMEEYVSAVERMAKKKGRTIDSYTKKELMDFAYKYVKKYYIYDDSIVGPGYSYTLESSELGGTAYITYMRNKGVCSGRSKLLKLITNNRFLNVPCYLVSGSLGPNGHMWNEFIDGDHILEYDLSTGENGKRLEFLSGGHSIERHEDSVNKVLLR